MYKVVIAGREFELTEDQITKAKETNEPIKIEQDLVIRAKDEEETFLTNVRAEARRAGVEVSVKEFKEKLGLSFEGKSIDKLVDAVQKKTIEDAKIEPEQKVKELQKDIEILKGSLTQVTTEKDSILNEFKGFKTESIINNTIASLIPEKTAIPKDDMILLIKNKMKFEVDETNKIVVKDIATGDVMKNPTTLDPLAPKDVLSSFFNQNPTYLQGARGGAGGDDSMPPGTKMTMEAFLEKKKAEGLSHADPKVIAEAEQLMKDGLLE